MDVFVVNQLRVFCVMLFLCSIIVASHVIGCNTGGEENFLYEKASVEQQGSPSKFIANNLDTPVDTKLSNVIEHGLYFLSLQVVEVSKHLQQQPCKIAISSPQSDFHIFLFNKLQLQHKALSLADSFLY